MKGREATYRAMIRLLLAFVEGRNTDEQERQYAIAEAHKLLSPSTVSNETTACEHLSASKAGSIHGDYWACDGCGLQVALSQGVAE